VHPWQVAAQKNARDSFNSSGRFHAWVPGKRFHARVPGGRLHAWALG
jgi:hypothetical protein